MATLALYAAGAAIGGPIGGTVLGLSSAAIGGAIGGIIGGIVDNTIIFPALFGNKAGAEGARLNELNVSGTEGNQMPFALGFKPIVDGQIIDKSQLLEEKIEEEQGGKGGGGATNTTYKYFMHLAVSWGETYPVGINQVLTIWANAKVIYTSTGGHDRSVIESIQHYVGSESQTPNSLLESIHGGTGTVPAYRGQAYTVIERLRLENFGNAIPQFRALLQCQNGLSVREAILRIHERWGVARSLVDVSRVNECLQGISISGPIPGNQLLEAIMVAYRLVRRESNGVVVFRHRGDEDHVTIDVNDLGAAPASDSTAALNIKDGRLAELATNCDVGFVDLDKDDQRGSVSARRVSSGTRVNRSINLPLVLTANRAKQIARQEIFRELVERRTVEFTLPPKYLHLEENDIADMVYKGRPYSIRVTQIERGANWQLVCQGVLVEDQVYQTGVTADTGTSGIGEVYTPPTLAWEPMDLPPLLTEHATQLGYYSAISAQLPAAKWLGANLYSSPDDSAWSLVVRRSAESTIGKATSVLASGPVGIWDRGNTVNIEMYEGELASVTDAEVLNGANWALIGDEIVGFATATLTGTSGTGGKLYTLSNLWRGLRDTSSGIATHATNERFVRLTTTSVDFNLAAYTQLATSRKFRAVPTGATVGSATSKTMTVSGRTLRPFSVADIRSSRDGSNNIEVTWKRRSRAMTRLFQTAPALDDQRVYDVVVKLAGSPIRTERVTDELWAYAAADQTTDGITPGDPVTIEVYQISTTVGRGNVATATV